MYILTYITQYIANVTTTKPHNHTHNLWFTHRVQTLFKSISLLSLSDAQSQRLIAHDGKIIALNTHTFKRSQEYLSLTQITLLLNSIIDLILIYTEYSSTSG